MNPFLEEVSGQWLAKVGRVRSGARDEAEKPGLPQLRPVIQAKDRNVWRIDSPVGRVGHRAFSVLLIHRIANECVVERAGATQHFLLRSGAAKKTSTGMNTVGKIQGKRTQSERRQASRRSERRLIRDLDPRFREGAAVGKR
jgi:hypothetical protein